MASTLKVQNIAHTGGTNALTVDSTGRILTPARPAFRVSKTSDDQPVNSGTGTKVTFNNVVFEVGSNIGTTDKFIAPIAGIYHFDASIRVGPDSSNANFYNAALYLKKNGNVYVILQQVSTYANNLSGGTAHLGVLNLSGGVTVSLAASDEIEVFVNLEGTSPEVKVGAASDNTWFSGFLVG